MNLGRVAIVTSLTLLAGIVATLFYLGRSPQTDPAAATPALISVETRAEASPNPASFEIVPWATDDIAKKLGFTDTAFALQEAETLVERVQGGYLPSAWNSRCKKEHSPALCEIAADYFGPRMGEQDSATHHRHRIPALKAKNLNELQAANFQDLFSPAQDLSYRKMKQLAELSLKRAECPRNFSLALGRSAEQHLGDEKDAADWMNRLDEHGLECLDKQDPSAEFLYLKEGLFRWARGDGPGALLYLGKSLEATVKREESRVLYWQWRIAKSTGHAELAEPALKKLQNKYPLSWQTILADSESNIDPMAFFANNKIYSDVPLGNNEAFNKRFLWLLLMIKANKGSQGLGRYGEFVQQTLPIDLPAGVTQHFARQMQAAGMHRLQILALNALLQSRPFLFSQESLKLLFPRPFFEDLKKEDKGRLDLAVLLALARQESSFDVTAVSRANAQGLFQILPSVARSFRRRAKLSNYVQSIQIALKHLTGLVKTFDGSAEKAIASYNAGPGSMRKWESRYDFVPFTRQDPQLFVDLIPFRETRDYVSAVLRNAYWYHRLYPDLTEALTADVPTSDVLRKLVVRAPGAPLFPPSAPPNSAPASTKN